MYIASWIGIGAVVGWVTGWLLRGNQFGRWMDVMVGAAGAVCGGIIIRYGGLPGRFEVISATLSAILGAVVLTVLTAFINGRKRYA